MLDAPTRAPTALSRSTTGMTYDAASGAWSFSGALARTTRGPGMARRGRRLPTPATRLHETCTPSPPATAGAQMAYDPTTHDIVLFGGSDYTDNFNDTWVLTFDAGTYSWTQVDDSTDPGCTYTCTSSPPTRNVAALTWDPATSQMVLFGGEWTGEDANGLSDTWLWSGSSWRQVDDHDGVLAGCGESLPTPDQCPSSPFGRVGTAAAYDPMIGRLVLFGGMNDFGSPEFDDTWVWNGRAWLQVDDATDLHCTATCPGAPQARDAFALADDEATHQLVMFGGNDLNNTWVAPATPPVPLTPLSIHTITKGNRVRVLWRMPLWAGPPILKYHAVASPGGLGCTSTSVLQCTIVGLAEGEVQRCHLGNEPRRIGWRSPHNPRSRLTGAPRSTLRGCTRTLRGHRKRDTSCRSIGTQAALRSDFEREHGGADGTYDLPPHRLASCALRIPPTRCVTRR